jgi:large subunit ribosomal protein L29
MKKLDIKELSTDEVRERIQSEKMHFNKMKLNHKISQIDKNHSMKETRKMVARLITELWEREHATPENK